jgi:phosphopantothenate-cysteine ligase
MIQIIITAGGTTESIDGVRKISNTSTGGLCACIYEALADYVAAGAGAPDRQSREFTVHYVVSETAVCPKVREDLPIAFYPVTDVKSTEAVLEKLMTENSIGYAVHGMAVSDFTKDYLIEREKLVWELTDTLERAFDENKGDLNGEKLSALIRDVLSHPERPLDVSAKVRSGADLMLSLKRTPKLIEKFKRLSPGSFLVGFKLLKGVPEEELIRAAAALSEKNGCDLVLANDLNRIVNGRHEGLLLMGSKVIGRYDTKKEIAEGIVRHMLGGGSDGYDGGGL